MEVKVFTHGRMDEQGVLNITDQSPPDGAEIIEVSPSNRKAAEKIQRERLIRQERRLQEQDRLKINHKAIQARKIEAEAQKKGVDLYQQAISENEAKGTKRKRRWSRRKAGKYYKDAQDAFKRAETARKQAEVLEKRLGS